MKTLESEDMEKPLVVIVMGSASDEEQARKIVEKLKYFELDYAIRVASAHKTVEHLVEIVRHYDAMSCEKLYITIAGRSNGLAGVVDGLTSSPTVTCPPYSQSFGGADIFSSLRMPLGIAPAVILEPENIAMFAARLFAFHYPQVNEKLTLYIEELRTKVLDADARFARI